VPVHAGAVISKMYRFAFEFEQFHERQPTFEELADHFDLSVERIEHLWRAGIHPISLESPMTADSDAAVFGDMIEDTNALSPYVETETSSLAERVRGFVDLLSKRQ